MGVKVHFLNGLRPPFLTMVSLLDPGRSGYIYVDAGVWSCAPFRPTYSSHLIMDTSNPQTSHSLYHFVKPSPAEADLMSNPTNDLQDDCIMEDAFYPGPQASTTSQCVSPRELQRPPWATFTTERTDICPYPDSPPSEARCDHINCYFPSNVGVLSRKFEENMNWIRARALAVTFIPYMKRGCKLP